MNLRRALQDRRGHAQRTVRRPGGRSLRHQNQFAAPDFVFFVVSGQTVIYNVISGVGTLVGPIVGAAFFLLMSEAFSRLFTATYLDPHRPAWPGRHEPPEIPLDNLHPHGDLHAAGGCRLRQAAQPVAPESRFAASRSRLGLPQKSEETQVNVRCRDSRPKNPGPISTPRLNNLAMSGSQPLFDAVKAHRGERRADHREFFRLGEAARSAGAGRPASSTAADGQG